MLGKQNNMKLPSNEKGNWKVIDGREEAKKFKNRMTYERTKTQVSK